MDQIDRDISDLLFTEALGTRTIRALEDAAAAIEVLGQAFDEAAGVIDRCGRSMTTWLADIELSLSGVERAEYFALLKKGWAPLDALARVRH